jgi:Rdx family
MAEAANQSEDGLARVVAGTVVVTQSSVVLPRITIRFCTQCRWMLRAAYVRSPHVLGAELNALLYEIIQDYRLALLRKTDLSIVCARASFDF